MSPIRTLPLAVTALLVSSHALADDLRIATTVSAGATWIHHTRASNNPVPFTERGTLAATSIVVQLDAPTSWFARLQLDLAQGTTDLHGEVVRGTAVDEKTRNLFLSPELDLGGRFDIDPDLYLVEYCGIGYRHWRRDIQADGAAHWDRSWAAIAIGTMLEARVAPRTRLVIDAALVPAFLAKVNLTGIVYQNTPQDDVSLSPQGKLGFRARIAVTHDLGAHARIGLLAGYDYVAFGVSALTTPRPVQLPDGSSGLYATMEPAASTHQVSGQATVSLSF